MSRPVALRVSMPSPRDVKATEDVIVDDESVTVAVSADDEQPPVAPTLKEILAAAAVKRQRPQFSINKLTDEMLVGGPDGKAVT
jgi:hypothetical protein